MRLFLLLIVSIPFILGCSGNEVAEADDVSQEKIHVLYEIKHNREKEQYIATAQFRFGGPDGTTLRLNQPPDILLNGEQMNGTNHFFRGWLYQSKGPLQKKYVFQYLNQDKDTLSNTFFVPDYGFYEIPDAFSYEKSAFKIKPISLMRNGLMTLTLSNSDTLKVMELIDPLPEQIVVDSMFLEESDTLYLEQKISYSIAPTATTDAGGKALIKLLTKKIAIPVVQ